MILTILMMLIATFHNSGKEIVD